MYGGNRSFVTLDQAGSACSAASYQSEFRDEARKVEPRLFESPADPAFWESGARQEETPEPVALLSRVDFNKKKLLMLKRSLKGAAARFMLGLPAGILVDYVALRNARFTLADPMPRLCPDAVGSANVNGLPTRNRPLGPHREAEVIAISGNIKHV